MVQSKYLSQTKLQALSPLGTVVSVDKYYSSMKNSPTYFNIQFIHRFQFPKYHCRPSEFQKRLVDVKIPLLVLLIIPPTLFSLQLLVGKMVVV